MIRYLSRRRNKIPAGTGTPTPPPVSHNLNGGDAATVLFARTINNGFASTTIFTDTFNGGGA